MGFFSGLANISGLQAANIYNNPEQAAVGANTPESTFAMNKTVAPTLNKHYTPTMNMTGGYTKGEMQQNAAQGYDNTGAQAANAAGAAAATYMTGGAAAPLVAGQMAADRYSAGHPGSTFDQQYNGLMANPNINAGVNAQNADINLANGVNKGYAMSAYNTGGLTAAAQHLQSKGRGQDTHLVHMTTSELNAMQNLAESKGGSLTINPHTGLPEAGFLSSALPMVLGAAAAMTGQEWAVPLAMALSAGGEYAMTGSLTQGLMAGLGAWGGAGIASGIEGLGASALQETTQAGGNAAEEALKEASTKSLEGQAMNASRGMVEPSVVDNAGNVINNMSNVPQAAKDAYTATLTAENANSVVNSAGQANTALNPNNPSLMKAGLTSGNLGSYAMEHPGQVAGVALPLLAGSSNLFKQPTVPTATTGGGTNPFGMKTIPKDANGNPIFNASIPAVPSPHYQAQYPNYVANPYNPMTAASGGLMDVHKMSSGGNYEGQLRGAQEMQQGLAQATMPAHLTDIQEALLEKGKKDSENGVYHLSDTEYAKLTPAALLKAHKIAIAKGLQPVGQLGEYSVQPAAQAAADQAAQTDIAQAAQQKTNAKEGGLMSMAAGGSPIYHPQYQNFARTPYTPQASSGIPVPTRPASVAPMGRPIDPLQMQGSPAYNAQQALIAQQKAEADAAAAAAQSSFGGDGGGGGASGGLPRDFAYAAGGTTNGHLGSYSDGGRLLKGPGDGVSDGIPATIGGKQPARLADGEFVIPARIVSELGNGSTDAGAKRLYKMMDRIKHARSKAKDIAADTKAYKYLPV
jgi:hypothetical protein